MGKLCASLRKWLGVLLMKGINHYTAIVDCCNDEISGSVDMGDVDARGEMLKGFIVRDIKKRFPKLAYYIITSY